MGERDRGEEGEAGKVAYQIRRHRLQELSGCGHGGFINSLFSFRDREALKTSNIQDHHKPGISRVKLGAHVSLRINRALIGPMIPQLKSFDCALHNMPSHMWGLQQRKRQIPIPVMNFENYQRSMP